MKVVVIKKFNDYEWGNVALVGQINDKGEIIQYIVAQGFNEKSNEWDSGKYYLDDLESAYKEYKRLKVVGTGKNDDINFYKELVEHFENKIEGTESNFLSQNYFSIISLLNSTIERLKEGE